MNKKSIWIIPLAFALVVSGVMIIRTMGTNEQMKEKDALYPSIGPEKTVEPVTNSPTSSIAVSPYEFETATVAPASEPEATMTVTAPPRKTMETPIVTEIPSQTPVSTSTPTPTMPPATNPNYNPGGNELPFVPDP